MMTTRNTFLQFLSIFMGLLCQGTNGCLENEQQALVMFKQGLTSRSDRLLSWLSEQDCCKWRGVECNYTTGHVITLDLRSPNPTETLQGELSSHLLDLPYLSHLDLSLNDFDHVQIPEFIGSFSNLKSLNLSNANFRGTIPNHLGNLTHLESLDLSGNGFSLRATNLIWLYGLSSLKVLNLNGVDLSNAVDWLEAVNMLPSLLELHLVFCKLNNLPSSLPSVNFTSLQVLDLSSNNFESAMPSWLFNISHSLVHLNFRRSRLQGLIPNAFDNMTSLFFLDLSENDLTGAIPTTLGIIWEHNQLRTHSSLRELHLSRNQLNGSLEPVLAQFSQLVILDLASNLLKGNITEAHLLNFTSLQTLNLSGNLLTLNVSSTWIPAFQLDIIDLQSCQLGPKFPKWLKTQNNFSSIDISSAGISDTVPDWFWNLSPWVKYMDLSRNQLTGEVPDFTSKLSLSKIDLSFNNFWGSLPRFLPSVESLVLAKNSFSGNLSSLCEYINVNNSLTYLDLSSNYFSGSIPDCWTTYGKKLVVLDLGNNSLSGNIPDSIGHLVRLKTLRLRENTISGHLPLALKNCTSLFILSLGKNKLSGKLHAWIGESFPEMIFLILDQNEFEGNIPLQLCRLKYMQILNLASNKLSGGIPKCVSNFLVMAEIEDARSSFYAPQVSYLKDEVMMLNRGALYFSVTTLPLIKLVDLSSNALSGEIPEELTSLTGLLVLNLSMNYLTGPIPRSTDSMKSLESIDLSRNQISCTIPTGLSELLLLSSLNLSYNNLSGKIPSGNQLATFSTDSYTGNPYLCGSPLSKKCTVDVSNEITYCSNRDAQDTKEGTQEGSEEDWLRIPPFYFSMGLGFITGLWGFWATLIISPPRRNAYYRFLNDLNDKVYVLVVVNVAKWRRKFQRE